MLEKYLRKISKQLFKFTPLESNYYFLKDPRYMKVVEIEGNFRMVIFNKDLDINFDVALPVEKYTRISPHGKQYIDNGIQKGILFPKGSPHDYYNISAIKHFKKFREVWNEYLDTNK